MCDIIGVNRSMKRESVKVKSHYEQMNDHNRIINCTMVYREVIGYTNLHRKGCGKSFLAFSKDTMRMKAWTIFCKTQDLRAYNESSSVFWSLYKAVNSTRPCPIGAVWIRYSSETRCCSWRPSIHQQRKQRTQTPKSLRFKSRKGSWK